MGRLRVLWACGVVALALVVRAVVDRSARLDGATLVPALLLAAVVLVLAAEYERQARR